MKIEQLPIYPALPNCSLTLYRHEENIPTVPPRRAVIVCPGGGYVNLSGREDEIVALQYAAAGFQVFLLHYGVGEHSANFAPLVQACSAIRYIREHATELHVRPDRIFITGFSAGGHLSASAGTMYRHDAVKKAFMAQYGDENIELGRPDGMILCYPVITSGSYAHRGSFLMLCGDTNATEEAMREFSAELWVDDHTPPTFLWHTSDDNVVNVTVSLRYGEALRAHNIPFEMHVFPKGPHGCALANEATAKGFANQVIPEVQAWVELSDRWMRSL
jgi:acetyl esterase/lipase